METMTRDALIREAREHFGAQRLNEAEAAADRILQLEPADFDGHYFKGFARLFANDASEALRHFDCAALVTRGHPFLEGARGKALRALGRYQEARECLETAVSLNDQFGDAWLMLGHTYIDLGEFALAERVYKRAADLPPFDGEAYARLSALRERTGDMESARAAVRKAVEKTPDGAPANIAFASYFLEAGEPDTALERLSARIDRPDWTPAERAEAYGLIGEAHEAKGDYKAAYAAFEKSNAAALQAFPDPSAASHGYDTASLVELRDAVASAPAELWREADPNAAPGPVFLIGFAQSGATLLGQALASHPQIEVVEDSGALDQAWRDSEGGFEPASMMSRIATLTAREAEAVDKLYRAAIKKDAANAGAPLFIDASGASLARAPLIRAIWPNARFILARRDPRDAVLAAFKARFAATPATLPLSTLSGAATYFDAAFGVYEAMREKAALNDHVFEFKSDDADIEAQLRSVVAFLGLEWSPAVSEFRAQANARTSRFANTQRFLRPRFEAGAGDWRNYEKQMKDALATLAPWTARLGYDAG